MKLKTIKLTAALVTALTTTALLHAATRAQDAGKPSRSVWDGAYTKEQAKRGESAYAQHCSSCHGPDLSGNDEAAALTGAAFLANWDGLTIGDLSERVRVS